MKNLKLKLLVIFALIASVISAREYHVSVKGNNNNNGTKLKPLRTISAAANLAMPGDIVIVHAGIYREQITPPRGGNSDSERIVYEAAPGERVEIKGSEIIKNWEKLENDTWEVKIPNSFFGEFNPYSDLMHGDWFFPNPKDRKYHTGSVYLNGDWLMEAAKKEEVIAPTDEKNPLWWAEVDSTTTTILAQFKNVEPNEEFVEINVRQTVFYPDKPFRNFITVRGFTMRDAATPWAPPTAEQIGLIGTHWSKGWIIENNDVSHSICSGITLGKYGDEWDNRAESSEGFVGTINRALTNGWNRETIGHHIVRNNVIHDCDQAGIVGSLGAAFSIISGNTIHDIRNRPLTWWGAEMAGIKIHAAIDVEISNNHIYRTALGLWLDWMAQGTHVTRNIFHDNAQFDLFVEVDHGPSIVDNNIFLSPVSVQTRSRGFAFAHNLFAGSVRTNPYDGRQTPFLKAHSTEVVALHDNPSGDDRFYNNLFVGKGNLCSYDQPRLPVWMAGNVFLNGAIPSTQEKAPLLKPHFDPAIILIDGKDGCFLEITLDKVWAIEQKRQIVNSKMLGKAVIPNLPFEQADGSPVNIDSDYTSKKRDKTNPFPGPFEISKSGKQRFKVW